MGVERGKGSKRDVPESQAAPVRPIAWAMRTEIGKVAMMNNVWMISWVLFEKRSMFDLEGEITRKLAWTVGR